MPLSVTITYPMPQAILKAAGFNVCGTYAINEILKEVAASSDRNLQLTTNSTITVTLSNGTDTAGPVTATPCDADDGTWEAAFEDVPVGNTYTVTATITQGQNTTSHAIEWVHAQANLRMFLPVQCCQDKNAVNPITVLALNTVNKKVPLEGGYTPAGADEIFCAIWKIDATTTTTTVGGGTHHRVAYRQGPVHKPGKYGDLDKPGKKWKFKDIEVDSGTYVTVHLKQGGTVVASAASALY